LIWSGLLRGNVSTNYVLGIDIGTKLLPNDIMMMFEQRIGESRVTNGGVAKLSLSVGACQT